MATIVDRAWDLARDQGIAGFSLRELAGAIGMRQPSLYEYFDSKDALYDAMFADGNRQLLERLDALELVESSRAALKAGLRAFVSFALADAARAELLFQRHLPGFTPSAESYALAEQALRQLVTLMHDVGVTEPGDVDCLTAVTGGVIEAQLSNDPTGDRWTRHLDRLVDLLVDDALTRST